jgi:hypothetical protein
MEGDNCMKDPYAMIDLAIALRMDKYLFLIE